MLIAISTGNGKNSTDLIDLEGNVAGEIRPEDRLHAEKCLAVKFTCSTLEGSYYSDCSDP